MISNQQVESKINDVFYRWAFVWRGVPAVVCLCVFIWKSVWLVLPF